jgi:translation initiation factor 2B subunit (eIF-2B alpha/beta/delta family)
MNELLKKIAGDSVSGSSDLLVKLSKLYKSFLDDEFALKKLAAESEKYFKSFALITSYIKSVKKSLNSGNKELIKNTVLSPLNRGYIYKQIFNNAVPFIKNVKTVFAFSNSGTVFEIIKQLDLQNKGKLKIYISESRPKNEGKKLAEKLLPEKINVIYGADVQMAEFISKCDAVFLGADKILKDNCVVNKTGSLQTAILAEYYKKPLYVFAESAKLSSSFRIEKKNPGEVWKKNHPELKVMNNYFEKVPAQFISRIFTENT